MLNTRKKKKKKKKRFFKCEIKTTSRFQQDTVKGVIPIEPNHLNSWFIQERNTVMFLRDAKLCLEVVLLWK